MGRSPLLLGLFRAFDDGVGQSILSPEYSWWDFPDLNFKLLFIGLPSLEKLVYLAVKYR